MNTYGQESPGWIFLFKLVTFLLLLKIYRNINFLVKFIGLWIPDGNGRGIARDIKKKIIVIFKTQQKMVTKLGKFTKLRPFFALQLFKLSKLCYHFLLSFENENKLSPPHRRPEFQLILPKNWCFCLFSTTKRLNWNVEKNMSFFVENIQKH